MALYECIKKCRHDRVYDVGDVAEFNGKPPKHFRKFVEKPPVEESAEAKKKPARTLVEVANDEV